MSKILHNLAITKKRIATTSIEDEETTTPTTTTKNNNNNTSQKKKIKLLKDNTSSNITTTATTTTNKTKKNKDQNLKNKKVNKEKLNEEGSSVVYLGHIAHGFYENELKKFFSQFGKVIKIKLVRSLKTGGSRGHAFIQFQTPEIAEVVASTLDGYFLLERQLVCHVVPVEKIHEGLFKTSKKLRNKLRVVKQKESNDNEEQKGKTEAGDDDEEEEEKENNDEPESIPLTKQRVNRFTRAQSRKQNRLKELGIDFNFLKTGSS